MEVDKVISDKLVINVMGWYTLYITGLRLGKDPGCYHLVTQVVGLHEDQSGLMLAGFTDTRIEIDSWYPGVRLNHR